MAHFPAAEPQGNFDLIALLNELPGGRNLGIQVIFLNIGRQSHFLDLNDLLFLSGLFFLSGLLITIFSVIDNLAYRRLRQRSNLHQIQLCLTGKSLSFLCRYDPKLLSMYADQTNFLIPDLFIHH